MAYQTYRFCVAERAAGSGDSFFSAYKSHHLNRSSYSHRWAQAKHRVACCLLHRKWGAYQWKDKATCRGSWLRRTDVAADGQGCYVCVQRRGHEYIHRFGLVVGAASDPPQRLQMTEGHTGWWKEKGLHHFPAIFLSASIDVVMEMEVIGRMLTTMYVLSQQREKSCLRVMAYLSPHL